MNALLRTFAACTLFGIAHAQISHLSNETVDSVVGRSLQITYLHECLSGSDLSPEDQTQVRRIQIVALGEMVYALTGDLVFAQDMVNKLSERWNSLLEKRSAFNDIMTQFFSAGAYFVQAATNPSREERGKAVSNALLCLAQLVNAAFQDSDALPEETAQKLEVVTHQMRSLILDDQVVNALSDTLVGFANGIRVMSEQQRLQASQSTQTDAVASEQPTEAAA